MGGKKSNWKNVKWERRAGDRGQTPIPSHCSRVLLAIRTCIGPVPSSSACGGVGVWAWSVRVCTEGICHNSRKNNLSKKLQLLGKAQPALSPKSQPELLSWETQQNAPPLLWFFHPHLCFCVLPMVDTYSFSDQDPSLFLGLVPFPWRAPPPSTPSLHAHGPRRVGLSQRLKP